MNTSFQFGGALVLAVVTAVNDGFAGAGNSAPAVLEGFHAALAVSLVVALLGMAAMSVGRRRAVQPA